MRWRPPRPRPLRRPLGDDERRASSSPERPGGSTVTANSLSDSVDGAPEPRLPHMICQCCWSPLGVRPEPRRAAISSHTLPDAPSSSTRRRSRSSSADVQRNCLPVDLRCRFCLAARSATTAVEVEVLEASGTAYARAVASA